MKTVHAIEAEPQSVELLKDAVPQQLFDCIRMCHRNVVRFEFFAATFDWLKQIALEEFSSEQAKYAAQCSVDALRAQAFKGAEASELELMHLEAEIVAVELNAKHGFDLQGTILREAKKSTVEELVEGAETKAAATKVVDALSLAYWDITSKLVDVLIEVVGKKTDEQYDKDLAAWQETADKLGAELSDANKQLRDAESLARNAADKVSSARSRLTKAEEQEQDRYQLETLITDAKRAKEKVSDAQSSKQSALAKQSDISSAISTCESELYGLGAFAFGKKKAKRQEIAERKAELQKATDEVASRDKALVSLLERANKLESLESQLNALPADQRIPIKEELELAKKNASKASGEVASSERKCNDIKAHISQHDKDKPRKASYSTKAAKSALRWRPALSTGGMTGSAITPRNGSKSPAFSSGSSTTTSAYRKGTSTWRSRCPSFSDSNPVHMTGSSSSGFNGSSYSASVGYQLSIDDPDMTHRMDIDVEGPANAFAEANNFLTEIGSAYRSRNYAGKFSFLRDFKCSHLPFTSIDTRLYVSALDTDEVGAAIGLIGAVNNKFPELAFDGVVEMVRSYAGIRNVYFVTSRAGSSTVNVEQKVDGLR